MNKIIVTIFIFFSFVLQAQRLVHHPAHSHDIGVFFGGSYYIGDLNPRKQFDLTQPAFGLYYRYNTNYRLAFRAGFNYGNIQGDDSQSDNADQLERNLSFKSDIYEINGLAEFNFWEYQIGHPKYEFAPYIFLGLDVFKFNPQASYQDKWFSLNKLSTEGQNTPQNPNQKPYKLTQVSIPFGVGFKLSLSKQVGLGFEWGPRKTFTDYLDDVSGKYIDAAQLITQKGYISSFLSDRSAQRDNFGKQRGNPVTKDWYFFCGFSLNFKIKFKPAPCPGVKQ